VNKLDLKSILKSLKLNESTISMALGAIVIVVVGVLVVNYFKDRGTTIPGLSEEGQLTTHTVAQGETLWSIAEKYYGSGFNWTDISKANNLENPGAIEVGQKLTLPDIESKLATTTEVKTPESEAITGATYEVVRGDNLWKIAVRAYGDGYKWVEIAKENKLVNPEIIHAGNILILPR
jgi:nucleoid-associated protein YgaU